MIGWEDNNHLPCTDGVPVLLISTHFHKFMLLEKSTWRESCEKTKCINVLIHAAAVSPVNSKHLIACFNFDCHR